MIPKPEPRARGKARASRQKSMARAVLRLTVLRRDQYRCRVCGGHVTVGSGHVHELVFRSQGGSPHQAPNCVTLCPLCHGKVHDRKLWLVATTDLGADGPLEARYERPS